MTFLYLIESGNFTDYEFKVPSLVKTRFSIVYKTRIKETVSVTFVCVLA